MKKRLLLLCLALCLLLTGCSAGSKQASEAPGRLVIAAPDAICQDASLLESGQALLAALSDDLLLCLTIDSAIPVSAEQLGSYDHIALVSVKWLDQNCGFAQLEAVAEDALPNALRVCLTQYMADRTVDSSVLPGGAALYTLKKGSLPLLSADGKQATAKQPLILLISQPAVVLRADTCLLPLAASGNLYFDSLDRLSAALSQSALAWQASVAAFK